MIDAIGGMDAAEVRATWGLTRIRGFGPVAVKQLVDRFGSACAVWGASEQELESAGVASGGIQAIRSGMPSDATWRTWVARTPAQVRLAALRSPGYPAQVRHIDDPPPLLWMQGLAHRPHAPVVAIVGSRRCTEWGRRRAYQWAYELASRNVVVV
ncbi:MAG: DNA-processing protein DprA, partial [Bacteroidetes bacterium]|nr:DNA-processing protein DprA [Bacteroidota bacterium]